MPLELLFLQVTLFDDLLVHAKVVPLEKLLKVVIVQQLFIVLLLHCRLAEVNHVLTMLQLAHAIPEPRRNKWRLHGLPDHSLPIVIFEPDM